MSVETVGQRVKVLREQHGYSQADVSRALGHERSWASKLERGAFARVSYEDVLALAKLFGMQPHEITGEAQAVPGPRRVAVPGLGRSVAIVNAADASGLTDHDRQAQEIMVTEDLIGGARRPAAYIMVGDCLREELIGDGDYLIVDEANKLPREGEIVVARVNGVLTAKLFHRDAVSGQIELRPAGPGLPVIAVGPDDELEIVGVYAAVLRTKRRK